ncbi:MAG: tetratricopeptide repeat protein [Woeseiaceae bacterium]|nr:tetratricopeptide repeat protein [Woeseiaceae bacterium]
MQNQPASQDHPQPEEAIATAKALLSASRPEDACHVLRDLLREMPEHEDALYVFAVSLRYAGRFEGARAALSKLQQLRPAYGRAWQEQGHLEAALGNTAAAKTAYKKAVARNNSLLASWQALENIAIEEDNERLLSEVVENRRRLAALPPELLSVRNMMSEKRLFKAERLCRAFLKENPQNIEGMRLLADLGVKTGVLDDAEFILESALEFEPDNRFARFDYMNVLYRRQKYAESLQQAKLLLEAQPGNPDYLAAYANQCVAIGNYDEALEIYESLAKQADKNAGLHLVHGHALKTIGRLDEAIASYRLSYLARRDYGDAYWSLANLKTYRFSDSEVESMRWAESLPSTSVEDRIHVCFALGKHYEDSEDFAAAADFYLRGNALKKDELQYKSDAITERLQMQRQVCDTAFFAQRAGSGCNAPDPIFIVGLPRAGSTLLEQILASHSQVDGTLELPNIPALASRLDGRRYKDEDPRYPKILADIPVDKLREFGEAFIEDTRVHRQDAPFFIDKMPNNFRHIGLIHLILPNATIIDARRHPMACCFSGFKQLFASGQEFTYGLDEIGRYYRDYVELMDHWDAVLPGKILRVQYEDVVADLETQVRRILEHCGLPFEEACLKFHRTERSVRTPSSEQVRQPIYKAGLEQWRNFEPYLDPLKHALGPVLQRYPIDD